MTHASGLRHAIETEDRPSMPVNAPLSGLRILVLDDEPMIALDIGVALEDAGAEVVGPFSSAADALARLATSDPDARIDGAILDIDLGDHTDDPLAGQLVAFGIPFVFHTGKWLEMAELLDAYRAPTVHKPAQPHTILAALTREVRRAA